MKAPPPASRGEINLLDQLEAELTRDFGSWLPEEVIRRTATDSLRPFDRARIKDYVPILAYRAAKLQLRSAALASA